MYSDVFCKVYNVFGWNYYPEIFGEMLLKWLARNDCHPEKALDLACGTGVLCEILHRQGMIVTGMDYSPGMIDIAKAACPSIRYDVADMTIYRPEETFDLVTCTGDAINHIGCLSDVEKIFRNVYDYLAEGGCFVFDILNEKEVSSSDPFEMDYDDHTRVWFQMTRPEEKKVNLKIRVYENGLEAFEENIRETIHDPEEICRLLRESGFEILLFGDRMLEENNPGTTWFLIGRKPEK